MKMKSIRQIVKELRAAGQLDEDALKQLNADARYFAIRSFIAFCCITLAIIIIARGHFDNLLSIVGGVFPLYLFSLYVAHHNRRERVNVMTYGKTINAPVRRTYGKLKFPVTLLRIEGQTSLFAGACEFLSIAVPDSAGRYKDLLVAKRYLVDESGNPIHLSTNEQNLPVCYLEQDTKKLYPAIGRIKEIFGLKVQ